MKLTNKLFASLMLTLLAVSLTGCKNLTPQGAAALTSIAVYEAGKDNPKLTRDMRNFQPLACAVAKSPGSTVEDVMGEIENTDILSADAKDILNTMLTIYQVGIATKGTNQSSTHPYLEAVICPGWEAGLRRLPGGAPAPAAAAKNAPPAAVRGKWLRFK